MKRVVILIVAAALGLLVLSPALAQKKVERKTYHADLECVACHNVKNPANRPENAACLACHGDMEALVKLTETDKLNPHDSKHWGADIPCAACHKEHRPSRSLCGSCHQQMATDIK